MPDAHSVLGSARGAPALFESFFLAGFECSSHRHRKGRRLDLLKATGHDVRAREDYLLVQQYGLRAVRDGLRWHLIEARPRRYDFSSFLPMLRAAHETRTQVIWDLMHYGWPSYIDIWKPDFADRFAAFAREVAKVVRDETDEVPFYTPVNEISFWSWGGGDVAYLNPFATGRGAELKRSLVRAAIASIEAIREIDPRARFVTSEPLVNIMPRTGSRADVRLAAERNAGQFEAMDFLCGAAAPELGGRPDYLDIVGVNYYYNNQWLDQGRAVHLGDSIYRPLRDLLALTYNRYKRPFFIAETGTEAGGRATWLHYVCDEVAAARANGVPVGGICLYPILNHPGWEDDRYCANGLFCGVAPNGERPVHQPLADELARQQGLYALGGR